MDGELVIWLRMTDGDGVMMRATSADAKAVARGVADVVAAGGVVVGESSRVAGTWLGVAASEVRWYTVETVAAIRQQAELAREAEAAA